MRMSPSTVIVPEPIVAKIAWYIGSGSGANNFAQVEGSAASVNALGSSGPPSTTKRAIRPLCTCKVNRALPAAMVNEPSKKRPLCWHAASLLIAETHRSIHGLVENHSQSPDENLN